MRYFPARRCNVRVLVLACRLLPTKRSTPKLGAEGSAEPPYLPKAPFNWSSRPSELARSTDLCVTGDGAVQVVVDRYPKAGRGRREPPHHLVLRLGVVLDSEVVDEHVQAHSGVLQLPRS